MRNFIVVMIVLAVGCAQAVVLMEENFTPATGVNVGDDIETGNLASGNTLAKSGGSGTWGEFSGTDLTYTGLQDSNDGYGYTHSQAVGENRSLRVTPSATWETGGVYMSFLLRVNDLTGMPTAWSLESTIISLRDTEGSNVLGLRNNGSGGYEIMVAEREADMANGPTDAQCSTAVTLAVGTTYLIVVGADNVADSTAGSFELWVNPTALGGAAPAATTSGEWRTSGGSNNDIFYLGDTDIAAAMATVLMDDVRVGTTFADVTPSGYVPEQGTVVMVK